MVQTLDIITVNLWQILIALANLTLLFFVMKKFLFKPVKGIFEARQAEIDRHYAEAEEAERVALADKEEWERKRRTAEGEAERILQDASAKAKKRASEIVGEADRRAEDIVRRAEEEALLERRKATDGIKQEIVEVSTALAEKMLERELDRDDHRALIDSFLDTVGESYDGSK